MRFWIGLFSLATVAWGADGTEARIRDAATRAVALIQSSQRNWYTRQTCASCHHQYQPALAFHAAWEHGVPVDATQAYADWVKAFDYSDLDRAIQYSYVIEPAMDDAYRLVAAHAAGVPPNLATAVYARLLAARQAPDGHWDSFHQRPPSSYSRFTETALALRAVQLYHHPSLSADAKEHVALGRKWLETHQPGNTEERTYQLLGLFWAGADKAAIQRSVDALKSTQLSDGGWSSLDGRDSDAYSTGEAMVALWNAIGFHALDFPGWQRGTEYLLRTQAADGSWHVESRLHPPAPVSPPYFETGYPYGHDQFLSADGACWAVMALVAPLGVAQHVTALAAPQQVKPANVPAWVETLLFGSVANVQRLLEHGFDANSADSGGTTALMMAAPDAAKMKLLLDHGAEINARAKTGYTALMVAAQYRESTAAIDLLLDRGAKVNPPDAKPALFHANPLFLAAYAGNAEVLRRLHQAGGRLDDAMVLIGTSPTTPLMGAARFGNPRVVSALLDLGANVDQADGSGITALGRAVLGNQVDLAKLLIARGADVNHVDKLGMTPLLHAASIDFGNSAMIDLLRKSGARMDARNKDGLSALDLARKYYHAHLIASLAR